MPRGVYDRKKPNESAEKKNAAIEEIRPEPVAPEPIKPQGHSFTVVEEWKPGPDMGEIKPPKDAELICDCLHKKAMHYGPDRDWCNTGGCQCQTFVKRK
jgi:hypothetical protein